MAFQRRSPSTIYFTRFLAKSSRRYVPCPTWGTCLACHSPPLRDLLPNRNPWMRPLAASIRFLAVSLLHPHVLEVLPRSRPSKLPACPMGWLPLSGTRLSGDPIGCTTSSNWTCVSGGGGERSLSAYKRARDGASTCCCLAFASCSQPVPARLARCSEKKPSAAAAPPPDTAYLSELRARRFESGPRSRIAF
jgi:hypothetical protein